jgi:1-acyl-sn-glycerol-3-phosphate acyltransferase
MFYIKVLLSILWFVVAALISFVAAFIRWRHPSNGYIFTQLFTKGVMFIIGMKINIHGEEKLLSNQPCVYIGNHQNLLDVLIHATCYQKRTIGIGKKEIFWVPLFGQLFYLCRNILIDRKNHYKAMKSMETARQWLQEKNISVYMFPEGTRNRHSMELLPFKRGAFHLAVQAQVPLLPVVASPTAPLVDLHKRLIIPGTINIEVLDPIATTGHSIEDVDGLIEKARNAMQETFLRVQTIPQTN